MKKILYWLFSLLVGTAAAAGTYEVHNVPDMFLKSYVATSTTTGIQVAAPVRNGIPQSYPTLTGGVLEFRQGSKIEHIYYSRATVNASTKVITLTGSIIRDLSWDDCSRYVSNGVPRKFDPGVTTVRLVDDCRLINFKANKDRANTYSASGATRYSGSGSYQPPYFATTTERDRQRPTPQPFEAACVTATGLCYDYIGGVWTARGNTGVGNADETTSGKVELGSVKDQSGATVTGDTGAATVVQTRYLLTRSLGTPSNGRIPVLTGGTLDVTVLPNIPVTKLNSGTNASATAFWRGDGTWRQIPRTIYLSSTGSNTVANSSVEVDFNTQTTLTGSTIGTGGMVKIFATGFSQNVGGSNSFFRIYLGSDVIATMTGVHISTKGLNFELSSSIQLRKVQVGGEYMAKSKLELGDTGDSNGGDTKMARFNKTGVNLTANQLIKLSVDINSADPGNKVVIDQFHVEYIPSHLQ